MITLLCTLFGHEWNTVIGPMKSVTIEKYCTTRCPKRCKMWVTDTKTIEAR